MYMYIHSWQHSHGTKVLVSQFPNSKLEPVTANLAAKAHRRLLGTDPKGEKPPKSAGKVGKQWKHVEKMREN